MSNKKQSSIEYLVEQLLPKALTAEQYYHIEQAKELHKQEIMDAYAEGAENEFAMGGVSRSDYYKNTYGKI